MTFGSSSGVAFSVNTLAYLQKQSLGCILSREVTLKISKNSQEDTCARVSFLVKLQAKACNFIKKGTVAQVFSYEFCETFKNTFFIEHLWWLLLYLGFDYNFEVNLRIIYARELSDGYI